MKAKILEKFSESESTYELANGGIANFCRSEIESVQPIGDNTLVLMKHTNRSYKLKGRNYGV